MATSQTSTLSKPEGDSPIPKSTLAYFRARLRQRIHSMILEEFMKSGLSQAELARRLGQDTAAIHRWLSAPRNLRLSTLSDLVFAIDGGEPSNVTVHPLDADPRNHTRPEWLVEACDNLHLTGKTPSKTSTSSQRQFELVNEVI